MTNDDEHSQLSQLIWENVRLLMLREYGKDNLTRLGKETGISTGGAQRLQQMKKVGPTVLARVAERFKVQPWQLLAPRLGADLYWRDQQNRFTCVYTAPLGELPAEEVDPPQVERPSVEDSRKKPAVQSAGGIDRHRRDSPTWVKKRKTIDTHKKAR